MDKDDHPELKRDIRLIALDTQWWLHQHQKSFGDYGDFDVNDAGDVTNNLEEIIRNRKKDYLILAAYHPLISNESHGGHFPFFQAHSLGANKNLRGFSNQRFTGRSSVYSNIEARFELVEFYRYLLGGKGGLLSFVDTGRVWADGEKSNIFHTGYGAGIWFNIFDQVILSASYGNSKNEHSFSIKAGFFF